ncbi:MAG: glycoside hydrolase family 99-like domain-containing protein [Capsulimonadaceae bacterium]|nr:glycoside hydrolase family 99-like domain-containing protein [Capsulimonadaceae bacterium]
MSDLRTIQPASQFDIAAYFWPAYHDEPRWRPFFTGTKGEWAIIEDAVAKFPGHYQPRIPLWGFESDSDPRAMERKIDAAASHGVNVFIFDWYWYDNAPFLEDSINEGYLKAANNDRVKFFIMWANHDAGTAWDVRRSHDPRVIWPGAVDRPVFDTIARRLTDRYLGHPSYYKIDGCPVVSIYDLNTLVAGLGGVDAARAALDSFRSLAVRAGFPDLHLQAIQWSSIPFFLKDVTGDSPPTQDDVIEKLGFDSVTSYQWIHTAGADRTYEAWGNEVMAQWDDWRTRRFKIPYFPHVSVGWDSNPRTVAPRPIVTDGSPALFEGFLRRTRDYVLRNNLSPRLITINSWNEWSEGSYIEPDERFGMGYLEAVKSVFLDEPGVR